jgi:hypothetical protein
MTSDVGGVYHLLDLQISSWDLRVACDRLQAERAGGGEPPALSILSVLHVAPPTRLPQNH